MRLFFAGPSEPYFTRRPMTLLDRGRGIYASPLPEPSQGSGGWRYYVVAVDDQFNETATEVVGVARGPRPRGTRLAQSGTAHLRKPNTATMQKPAAAPDIPASLPMTAPDTSNRPH